MSCFPRRGTYCFCSELWRTLVYIPGPWVTFEHSTSLFFDIIKQEALPSFVSWAQCWHLTQDYSLFPVPTSLEWLSMPVASFRKLLPACHSFHFNICFIYFIFCRHFLALWSIWLRDFPDPNSAVMSAPKAEVNKYHTLVMPNCNDEGGSTLLFHYFLWLAHWVSSNSILGPDLQPTIKLLYHFNDKRIESETPCFILILSRDKRV